MRLACSLPRHAQEDSQVACTCDGVAVQPLHSFHLCMLVLMHRSLHCIIASLCDIRTTLMLLPAALCRRQIALESFDVIAGWLHWTAGLGSVGTIDQL